MSFATRTGPAWLTLAGLALVATACAPTEPESRPSDTTDPAASGTAAPSPTDTPTTASPEAASVLNQEGVAAAHPDAVAAGITVLESGGNAVDAAIAAAFAIGVVEPYASGMGGGGAALIAGPEHDPEAWDYREVVAENGEIPASGTGVPGMVAGMAALHEEHGSLEWSDLITPAQELAAEGSTVTELLAQRLRSDFGPASIQGLDAFHDDAGQPLAEGDTLIQPELAQTLSRLAEQGAESFYTGELSEQLTHVDGLDAATLDNYEPERTTPVSGTVGEYEVLSAAPPLPGAAVIQQLQVSEGLDAASAQPGSADYIDALSRAWLVADASVSEHFGDPDFVDVPVDELVDAEANQSLARNASLRTSSTSSEERDPVEPGNTTHLTVVDDTGMMVSMTNTLTSFWGGSASENVGGFFLNDQLSRFNAIDTPNNQPEPGRKSVSWSAPSMLLDAENRPVLGIGTPGGHQIPNILTAVLVPWALQGASLEEAVAGPRHSLQNGVLALESEPSSEVADLIRNNGWDTQVTTRADAVFGSVQALEIDYDAGEVIGARDTRRDAEVTIIEAD